MRAVRRDGVEVTSAGRSGRHVAGVAPVVPPQVRARGRRARDEDPDGDAFGTGPLAGQFFDPLTDPFPEALLEPLPDAAAQARDASRPDASRPDRPVVPGPWRSHPFEGPPDVDDTRSPTARTSDGSVDVRERPAGRRPAPGVVRSLLRNAVALQAEDLLRSIGALAVAAQRGESADTHVDWIGWVERDVRDLGHLARAALEVGATLPAGLDVGGGDPARPETVIEGLLAGHEAVLAVLRDLDAVGGTEPWNAVVGRIAARREAEAAALRVTVGDGSPREPDQTHTGRPPDAFFTPDLLY